MTKDVTTPLYKKGLTWMDNSLRKVSSRLSAPQATYIIIVSGALAVAGINTILDSLGVTTPDNQPVAQDVETCSSLETKLDWQPVALQPTVCEDPMTGSESSNYGNTVLASYASEDGNFILYKNWENAINVTGFSLTVYNANEHTAAQLDGYEIQDKRHWAKQNKLLVTTGPAEESDQHTYYFVDAVEGTIERIGEGYRGRLSGYTPIDIVYDLQNGCNITFNTVTKERINWCE